MILHCTKKLASRLPAVSTKPLMETSPLGSWHANLYTIDRRQCLIFSHDTTRYVLFLAGLRKEQFERLGELFAQLFLASLIVEGVPEAKVGRVKMALGPVSFDTATDRSVLSTLNVTRSDLDGYLDGVPNVLDVDPLAASLFLNQRPVTIRRKCLWPNEEMTALLGKVL